MEDFKQYQAHKRRPLQVSYGDSTIWTNPPLALGGTLIGLALKLIAGSSLSRHKFGSLAHLEILARAMQLTGRLKRERAGEFPDDFDSAESLLDKDLLAAYRSIGADRPACPSDTTHISVIDADGNVAALNLSNGTGSGIMVSDCGFMLNNMLGEEDLNPAGFHQWKPNTRIASMMSPTLIFNRDGVLATGSGGSNRIRSAILQVILNHIDFAMPVDEAVQSPRIHYENGLLHLESNFSPQIVRQLKKRFSRVKVWPGFNMFFGGAHTVLQRADGEMAGTGDNRRLGVCLRLD